MISENLKTEDIPTAIFFVPRACLYIILCGLDWVGQGIYYLFVCLFIYL